MKSEVYICRNCGRTFEEPAAESAGKAPYGDTYVELPSYPVCPYCGGDFEEACECESCGEYFREDDLTGEVCEKCFKERLADYEYNYNKCEEIGKGFEEEVKLNPLYVSLFSPREIEIILKQHLVDNHTSCADFINEDKEWFNEVVTTKESNDYKKSGGLFGKT